ncbi:MAG: general stress protein [Sphingobacteriales bacterium]|nr:MAG: general stress protein [Sphingobacteriales bacterium]
MGGLKNLRNQEAIDKIKEIAEGIKTCMFCTSAMGVLFETRPMATREVDEEGNIWFLSAKGSNKNEEIKQDDQVQLIYADNSSSTYMVVYGHADVFYDRQKVEELWNPLIKTWFHEGKDDPNISIIRVRPDDAYYWDTKNGKMVSFLKIVAGAITGKTADDGVEGRLDV